MSLQTVNDNGTYSSLKLRNTSSSTSEEKTEKLHEYLKKYGSKTTSKRVSLPRGWTKPGDSSIVCRYIIRDKYRDWISDSPLGTNIESGWVIYKVKIYACVRVTNNVRRTWQEMSKGCMTHTHVTTNNIRSCDCTMVVLKVLRMVYDWVIVLWQYCKYWDENTIDLVMNLL